MPNNDVNPVEQAIQELADLIMSTATDAIKERSLTRESQSNYAVPRTCLSCEPIIDSESAHQIAEEILSHGWVKEEPVHPLPGEWVHGAQYLGDGMYRFPQSKSVITEFDTGDAPVDHSLDVTE